MKVVGDPINGTGGLLLTGRKVDGDAEQSHESCLHRRTLLSVFRHRVRIVKVPGRDRAEIDGAGQAIDDRPLSGRWHRRIEECWHRHHRNPTVRCRDRCIEICEDFDDLRMCAMVRSHRFATADARTAQTPGMMAEGGHLQAGGVKARIPG